MDQIPGWPGGFSAPPTPPAPGGPRGLVTTTSPVPSPEQMPKKYLPHKLLLFSVPHTQQELKAGSWLLYAQYLPGARPHALGDTGTGQLQLTLLGPLSPCTHQSSREPYKMGRVLTAPSTNRETEALRGYRAARHVWSCLGTPGLAAERSRRASGRGADVAACEGQGATLSPPHTSLSCGGGRHQWTALQHLGLSDRRGCPVPTAPRCLETATPRGASHTSLSLCSDLRQARGNSFQNMPGIWPLHTSAGPWAPRGSRVTSRPSSAQGPPRGPSRPPSLGRVLPLPGASHRRTP